MSISRTVGSSLAPPTLQESESSDIRRIWLSNYSTTLKTLLSSANGLTRLLYMQHHFGRLRETSVTRLIRRLSLPRATATWIRNIPCLTYEALATSNRAVDYIMASQCCFPWWLRLFLDWPSIIRIKILFILVHAFIFYISYHLNMPWLMHLIRECLHNLILVNSTCNLCCKIARKTKPVIHPCQSCHTQITTPIGKYYSWSYGHLYHQFKSFL